MLFSLKRRAVDKAEARRKEDEQLAQLEIAAFGDVRSKSDVGKLTAPEVWWSQHYTWLKDHGYNLRPRYAPDWVPSWQETKKSWLMCEDSQVAKYPTRVMDAIRTPEDTFVLLKLVNRRDHPHEIDIAQYFSSPALATSANHCVPIYDVLAVPDEEDKKIIVMPLLRHFNDPPFDTFGEAVDCIRQLFEGLHFMHKHRVAHRDCSSRNIMMDPSKLFIDAFHPASSLMKRDFSGYARHKSRTERPPKYFIIDFGLSRRYDESVVKPLEDPIWGGDKEVPEFQNSGAPCDPFPTDVFYIGNTVRKVFVESKLGFDFIRPLITDMVQQDPSKRPTMAEVVQRFDTICAGISRRKLRSRVADKGESTIYNITRSASHWILQVGFIARGLPAVPKRS